MARWELCLPVDGMHVIERFRRKDFGHMAPQYLFHSGRTAISMRFRNALSSDFLHTSFLPGQWKRMSMISHAAVNAARLQDRSFAAVAIKLPLEAKCHRSFLEGGQT